MNRPHIRHLG